MTEMKVKRCVLRTVLVLMLFTSNSLKFSEGVSSSKHYFEMEKESDLIYGNENSENGSMSTSDINTSDKTEKPSTSSINNTISFDSSIESTQILEITEQSVVEENPVERDFSSTEVINSYVPLSFNENRIFTTPATREVTSTKEVAQRGYESTEETEIEENTKENFLTAFYSQDNESSSMYGNIVTSTASLSTEETHGFTTKKFEDTSENKLYWTVPTTLNITLSISDSVSGFTTSDSPEKYTKDNKMSTHTNDRETSSSNGSDVPSLTLPYSEEETEDFTTKKFEDTSENKFYGTVPTLNVTLSLSDSVSTHTNEYEASSSNESDLSSSTVPYSEVKNYTEPSKTIPHKTSFSIKSTEPTSQEKEWDLNTQISNQTTENNLHGISSSVETSPTRTESVLVYEHLDFLDTDTKTLITEYTVWPEDNTENDGTTFKTDEVLFPEPPKVDFFITNVTSNSFTIEWKKPSSFSKSYMMYYVSVKDKGPAHYVRPSDIRYYNESYEVYSDEPSFLEHDASPNSMYEIEMFAGNEFRNGTSEMKKITTNSSYSSEPLNVTSYVEVISNHCNGTEYKATLHLKWELPMNTNGKLQSFLIEITGKNYFNNFSVIASTDKTEVFYNCSVPGLNASSEYRYKISPITAENIVGNMSIGYNKTPDGCPSKPTSLTIDEITSSGFRANWKLAEDFFGLVLGYDVEIKVLRHSHFVSNDIECNNSNTVMFEYNTTGTTFTFTEGLPDYEYQVAVRSRTITGPSEFARYESVTTVAIASTPVRDLYVATSGYNITEQTYKYNVTLLFKQPCNTNGPFQSYLIRYFGYRRGYRYETYNNAINDISETNVVITLNRPEYNYTFEVSVVTGNNYSSNVQRVHIKTISGVPPVNPESLNYKLNDENPIQLDTVLKKDVFNDSMGNIMYYGIILFPSNESINPKRNHYGKWMEKWPLANKTVFYYRNESDIIQLTENNWNPFNDSVDTINICIGQASDCILKYDLIEDTSYFIVTRGLTKNTYIDIYTLIKTGKYKSNVWTIITIILFFLLLIVCAIYLYYKKGESIRIKFKRISNATGIEGAPRHVIAVKNMSSYYHKIADDPEILRQQYNDIEDETRAYKEKHVKNEFALKPENKRKNRYINILPYDENRIRLNIDEDDEISSDYINASYIKGFSGEIEYIASQGPLEHTCRDFWKMVIQENVTVIVMVSHFVENEKEKCFKYFPRNYENLLICEDLEVKCLTELQFDTYCVRTLLVRKDIRQYPVVHLQYLDWPDFGCPSGTSNMLFFCQEVRDRIKLEEGKMIVHCSAGVGRTGTLISLDILLQAVKKKKEISIFETVLQLRKQRTHMVQTEKQYVYLHTCIKDALENEALYLREGGDHCEEHTYKNASLNKKYLEGDFGIPEEESAF